MYWKKNPSVLENAIWSSVHVYDIGTRGEHGDNAVSLVRYLSRIIHNLKNTQKHRIRREQVETFKMKKACVYLHSHLSTQLLHFLAGLREHICSNDWVSVLQQVLCHWVSHIAQTNKPDLCLWGHRPCGDYNITVKWINDKTQYLCLREKKLLSACH